MLESFSRHGGIDLFVETKGDLHIDMHHTIEDTGIVLGQAVAKALDGFKGIRRFGSAYIPMDETLSRCALDLSNRAYLIYKVEYARPKVGDVDTELFKEFHQAFAMNAGACVHLETLYGSNSHHIAESGFKALARALRQAVELDPKTGGMAPSTKGVL
jgi:imidazoleglycerol-phosphate dehydratase